MTISLFDTVENTVGKGENAGGKEFTTMVKTRCYDDDIAILRW